MLWLSWDPERRLLSLVYIPPRCVLEKSWTYRICGSFRTALSIGESYPENLTPGQIVGGNWSLFGTGHVGQESRLMKGVRSSTDGALTPALAVTTKLRNSKDRKFQTAARLVPKAAIKQGQWFPPISQQFSDGVGGFNEVGISGPCC